MFQFDMYDSLTGDQPLDLASTYFLAMDWKNSEKLQPYVMVQSKPLVSLNLLNLAPNTKPPLCLSKACKLQTAVIGDKVTGAQMQGQSLACGWV